MSVQEQDAPRGFGSMRVLEEAEAQMRKIAHKHGLELRDLRGKGRLMDHCEARYECYRLLLARGWNYPRIAKYFNRRRQTVMAQLDPDFRARRKRYLKAYHAARKQEASR